MIVILILAAMSAPPRIVGLGTRLRHVLELLDGDVAKVYDELGLDEYRTRFSPIVKALVAAGPSSIRDLAEAIGVTHSAASQTVARLSRAGLVSLEVGGDARRRVVHLTERARALLPVIETEWDVTATAARELEAELPMPLTELIEAVLAAVERRPFRERIADVARARLAEHRTGRSHATSDSGEAEAVVATLRSLAGA
jgi:DNA-binding MarR family transcriptional regulator